MEFTAVISRHVSSTNHVAFLNFDLKHNIDGIFQTGNVCCENNIKLLLHGVPPSDKKNA